MKKTITQNDVTTFYDQLIFPSQTSHCDYVELLSFVDLKGLVADFGCGQSLFLEAFKHNNVNAIFLDISINVLHRIDYGRRLLASLTDIPLDSGSVDSILCIGVIHHIPEMEKSIREIIRVLRNNGMLVIGVYAANSLQAKLRKLYDHLSGRILRWTMFQFVEILIWIKNRRNGLVLWSVENRKRAEDLLLTPLVRYLPLSFYEKIFIEHGCRIIDIRKISSMNILILKKISEQGKSKNFCEN